MGDPMDLIESGWGCTGLRETCICGAVGLQRMTNATREESTHTPSSQSPILFQLASSEDFSSLPDGREMDPGASFEVEA